MKRSIKFTKFQELETERKQYADETIRLKHLLSQNLN